MKTSELFNRVWRNAEGADLTVSEVYLDGKTVMVQAKGNGETVAMSRDEFVKSHSAVGIVVRPQPALPAW